MLVPRRVNHIETWNPNDPCLDLLCFRDEFRHALSAVIMVQRKVAIFETPLLLEIHPFGTRFRDNTRKGRF